jgi:hypothetical protein
VFGPHRHGSEHPAERLDGVVHEADRHVGEDRGLRIGLVDAREQPVEHLQQHLIGDVEQVRRLRGQRLADERTLLLAFAEPHAGRHDESSRFERRIRGPHGEVLVQDALEPTEVGITPLAPRPLPLVDDRLDRRGRAGQVGHRDELRPGEVRLCDL